MGGVKKGKAKEKSNRAGSAGGGNTEGVMNPVDAMDVDEEDGVSITPLPTSGGIQDLREKLHAKMNSFRRGRDRRDGEIREGEAGSKDELLEERRRQRALLRERRRKETKDKIRRQEEERGKKGKGRDKDQAKHTPAKVCLSLSV